MRELPDVGRVTLEDAETGEQIEINTSDARTRTGYVWEIEQRADLRQREFRRFAIDTISLRTNQDYVPALRTFARYETLEVTATGTVLADQTWELDGFKVN